MPANPTDIARYTSDGALITLKNEALKDTDPNAQDAGDRELAMFFDSSTHGQIIANELFAFVSAVSRPHEGVEIEDGLGLGSTVPVFPKAPRVHITDPSRLIDTSAVIRAYAFDMSSDRYALELVGLVKRATPADFPTFDRTNITFDNTTFTWDMEFDPYG